MNTIKKFFIFIAMAMVTQTMVTQTMVGQTVRFSIINGYEGSEVEKKNVETNITAILNSLQEAGMKGGVPDMEGVKIEPSAKTRLLALWNDCPFVCEDMSNVYACLTDFEGYQVRDIPVNMKPQDDLYPGEKARELVISLDKSGVITGVRLALNNVNAAKVMGTGSTVKDMSERRTILKFIEDMRSFYTEKDFDALSKLFSGDDIIITNSGMQRKQKDDILSHDDIVSNYRMEMRYGKRNMREYLEKMKRCFMNEKYINMKFDKVEVVRHSARDGYYGVTVHQKWETSRYNDEGSLFMLWDFTNDVPVIRVIIWQPYPVCEDNALSIDDFLVGS